MIDNEIDRDVRVDLSGIGTKTFGGISHGCQIDHSGHTSEILKDHTGGLEGYLSIGLAGVGYIDAKGRAPNKRMNLKSTFRQ